LEDPETETLTIEGASDIVDVELARRSTPRRPLFQVKSRQEPYTWPPSEVADVIRDWERAGGGSEAPLRFVSDGSASPDTARLLAPALERARAGAVSADDCDYFARLGIDADGAAYVELATQSDGTGGQLAMAENRARRLLALVGPVSGDAPQAVVDRLFRLFAVHGGERAIERRTFTREDLAAAVGVDLSAIDSGDGWSDEIATIYRSAVAAEQALHPLVELAALLDSTPTAPALALTVTSDDEPRAVVPASTLIDGSGGAGVCGAAGTGKTTAATQMKVHAAQGDQTAVMIVAPGYRRGDLDRRIRRVLEKTIGRPLASSVVADALGEGNATLLVDGLEGLSVEQRDAVLADLREFVDRLPDLRLVLVARERWLARRFGLPTYTLSPLDTSARIAIAESLVDDAAEIVADLEGALGDVVDNPLLFVMALALTRAGVSPETRPEIFAGFVDGLRERAMAIADETDLSVLRHCANALSAEQRVSADRYWWISTAAEALEQLRADGLYEVGQRTAESVFSRLLAIGLLFEDEIAASVSLLHDSFRDYFTSVALTRGEVEHPAVVSSEWEAAFELVSEQGGLTAEYARAIARDNVVAAVRAARFDKAGVDAMLTGELTRTLIDRHLGASPFGAQFGVVVVSGAEHRLALVAPGGEDGEMTPEEAAELGTTTPLAVALSPDAGPLALATALWRECLKKMTASEPPSLLRPIPETAEGLAEAVRDDFVMRQAALVSLAERLVPTMADRLIDAVGWSGLRGHVRDPVTHTPFPGQSWTFHPLEYDYGGDDVVVTAAPSPPPAATFRSHAVAEAFVETSPQEAALDAFVDAVNELLPEVH
jgi:hypothetical protein